MCHFRGRSLDGFEKLLLVDIFTVRVSGSSGSGVCISHSHSVIKLNRKGSPLGHPAKMSIYSQYLSANVFDFGVSLWYR
jgi:hypothetical protein